MELAIKIIGYIAAIATTISFVPQAVKVIKTKDTKSISLSMYVIFTFGVALWSVYGILLRIPPIIIANFVTLVMAVIILIYKLKEK